MNNSFIDTAYDARDADGTRAMYDDWATSYEAEVTANGYATPARCAEALADCVEDRNVALLDFGCGTGLAGLAFKRAGFKVIDGVDLSPTMIEQARAKGIYRSIEQIEPDTSPDETYAVIAAVGVIGEGGAPISTLDLLLHALPSGGKLVFSFDDATLADPTNTGRLNEWLDCGAARLLFSEHGPHFPTKEIESTVYVVEKA